ncbi:MAG: glutamate racemase [Defluviitaleaceae bacterium]|nr:glutamate racemase [Defluviitaleaceae bacterium]
MNRPIGIFDSGIGGLTVLQEIQKQLPYEDIIYVGDTARAPYGGKTEEVLISHGRDIIRFLLTQNVKAIVMACGTSSSTSFEQLQSEFPDVPMIDTIRPGAEATLKLAATHPDMKLCFIATAATIKNGLFTKIVSKAHPSLPLHVRACPMFAPMIESGLSANHILLKFAAETYLSDLHGKVNTVVLGCTHYPMLTEAIIHVLGKVDFINPAKATASTTKIRLENENMLTSEVEGNVTLYASGNPKAFARTAKGILKEDCTVLKAPQF